LNNLGLTELIADSPDAYVAIAVRLANDPDMLGRLRELLRTRMAASPLCAAPRFTRQLEQAYLGMLSCSV